MRPGVEHAEKEIEMSYSDSVKVEQNRSIPLILRILWFIFLGWEITGFWILVAWLLNVTVIGLPLGLWMIDKVPFVLTLSTESGAIVTDGKGSHYVGKDQYPFVLRAIYFVVIGWWLSLGWSIAGWLLCLTIIGLPIGLLMLHWLPAVTTLRRR